MNREFFFTIPNTADFGTRIMNIPKLIHRHKETLESIIIFLVIGAFVVLMSLLFGGCKAYRVVERTYTDTLIVRDSVSVLDTIYQTRIEREIIEREVLKEHNEDYRIGITHADGHRVDTIYIHDIERITNSRDKETIDSLLHLLSINNSSQVSHSTTAKETDKQLVEKPLSFQQRALMLLGTITFYLLFIAAIGAAAYFILKKFVRK